MLFRLYSHWRGAYTGIPVRIWLLSLVSLVNRCGAMVVVFLTIYLTKHLSFSLDDAGYILGCFGAGAFTGAFLGGKLTDRYHYYPIMLWSLIGSGIMLLLLIWLQGFWTLCAAIFVLSVISEVFRPANSVAVARYSTPETRTRSISLYRMSVNLGWVVAPALGGMIVGLGWHWLFVADGVTCILAALLLRLFIAPKPAQAQPDGADAALPATSPAAVSPYRDKTFLFFTVLTVLNAIVFMQFLWTVPIFFKEKYHWDENTIGLVAALNGLMVFLIEMPMIYQIEGRKTLLQFVRLGLVLYATAYLAFLLPPGGMISALIFITAISFGEMFVMPFSTNFVFGYSEKGRAGSFMALYTIAYSVANTIAPLLGTQVVYHWGYGTLWTILVGLSAISWVGFWALERKDSFFWPKRALARPE